MSHHTDQHSCGVCLDFGYLPDVGPCPRCRPDEYAEYILLWARDAQERESHTSTGDAA